MAPSSWLNTATTTYGFGYYVCQPTALRIECRKHEDITSGWCNNHYFPTVVSRDDYAKVQHILYKMKLAMCKTGWTSPNYHYLEPTLKPIPLRNVKYDGRGWANSK
jgi:hypothetical protein